METQTGDSHAFRPDIQILRGVAVLSVLAYHLLPAAVPAGFLGVDVFFVVSGFLMAHLYGDMRGVSALTYWRKRARRILPAYFAVIAATLLVAAFVVVPHQLRQVAHEAGWALALAPNIGSFLGVSYFDAVQFRPLLHLWSLGVEAQFYLIFPLFAFFWRKSPALIIVLAALTFAACLLPIDRSSPFFLTPFRMWEFTLGFAVGRLTVSPRGAVGLLAGLAIIPLLFMPGGASSHPGWLALIVCALTAVCLAFQLPVKVASGQIGHALQAVGKYSYSLYLVHFPVIMLVMYRPFEGNGFVAPSLLQVGTILACTLVATLALFHLVENPGRRITDRRVAITSGLLALTALGLTTAAPRLAPRLYPTETAPIFAAWDDADGFRCGKLFFGAASCELSPGERPWLLVGDSHADAIKASVVRAAGPVGVHLFRENCALGAKVCTVEAVEAEARRIGARGVIAHSAWGNFEASGVKAFPGRLVVIAPVPVYPSSVPQSLYRGQTPSQSLDDVSRQQASIRDVLSGLDATVIDPAPLFCDPTCAVRDASGRLFYRDDAHLTLTGARLLEPILKEVLARPPYG